MLNHYRRLNVFSTLNSRYSQLNTNKTEIHFVVLKEVVNHLGFKLNAN